VSPKALLTLLALGAIWGASFLFIKVIVEETSPLELAEGRMFFGALAVGAVMAARKTRLRWRRSLWVKVAVWTLVGIVVPFNLIAWAEEHIASGTASVLNSTMPIFTALFAAAFLMEEQFTPGRAAGLVVGFVGVVVLTGGKIYDLSDSSVLGQLAVVSAAACYGAAAVYARSLLKQADPLGLSGSQLMLGTLLALPILLAVRGTPDYSLSAEAWLSLLALGVLGTGIAIIAYLWLVDNVGSVRGSLVTYIIPILGLFLGWAVLDESIGVNTVLGCALIIAGVAAVMRGQAPSSQRLAGRAEVSAAE
jgi:drug/metabolite transporter (DMT)-like permease